MKKRFRLIVVFLGVVFIVMLFAMQDVHEFVTVYTANMFWTQVLLIVATIMQSISKSIWEHCLTYDWCKNHVDHAYERVTQHEE